MGDVAGTATTRTVTWKKINTWLGHVVFGLPALLAIPALIATAARFGWWETLTVALPAAAWACTPLLLWIIYMRRRRGRRLAWVLLLIIAVVVLAVSPIYFWAAPATIVLLLEAARAGTGTTLPWSRLRKHRRPRPTKDIAVHEHLDPAQQDGPAR